MHTFFRDFRYAARQLSKSPAFSITVILTLALGIGATTAIFSLVEAILLSPLPFARPDRLVMLGEHIGTSPHTAVTARDIDVYSRSTSAFSSLGGFATFSYELSGGEVAEQVDAGRFNASVFTTLGVPPILGRVFTSEEEKAHQSFAVISDRLWQNRFHRDPQVLGTSIVLDRKTYSIIGVMPRGFSFPLERGSAHPIQLWLPLSLTPDQLSEREAGNFRYQMIARLKDDVSLRQAAEDAGRVSRQIMQNYPPTMSAIHIRGDVTPLRDFFMADMRPVLRTLFLAVSAVLLVACVNVAGLLLVRAIRRRRDYAVRLALGARSRAIFRESISEGILLSAAGAALGLALVAAAMRVAPHFLPDSLPRVDAISINPAVAAFAIFLALLTGTLCSLAPAFAAVRTNLTDSLKDGARTSSGTAGHTWLRSALVVVEIALALVLLNTSAAFIRSYRNMVAIDPGFRPDHLLVAGYQLPLLHYPTEDAANAFTHLALQNLGAAPGVSAVAVSSILPGSGLIGGATYTVESEPENQWKLKFAMFTITDGDYFQAMRIPLLDGRAFTPDDRSGTPGVIIVNQTMAKHCWPGRRAIGQRVHVGNPKKGLPWATVVGVVADTRVGSRDEPTTDQWYFPARQPETLYGSDYTGLLSGPASGFFIVRSVFPPEQMVKTLRSTIAAIDPLLALEQVRSMNDVLAHTEAPRRFNTDLVSGFAAGALLLAVTGIYAVVAFSVSLRTQEIAIRLALGAQRNSIARLVLTSGAKLGLIGCALGLAGSLVASRLVSSFLFEVSPTDPFLYLPGVVLMMLMVFLASALPAARAASANPIASLRAI
ncbi:MAG TPA: ABC transporter permease [Terracidiphilus sp.]|jgi:putative ABC transport system permease protein